MKKICLLGFILFAMYEGDAQIRTHIEKAFKDPKAKEMSAKADVMLIDLKNPVPQQLNSSATLPAGSKPKAAPPVKKD